MKARNNSTYSPLYHALAPNLNTFGTIATTYALKDYVGTSALIRGDHKRPNPWSYEITDFGGFKILNDFMEGFEGSFGSVSYNWVTQKRLRGSLDYRTIGRFTPPDKRTESYNVALGRLNEKVRGSLDISVDLAESQQTFRMLKNVRKFQGFIKEIGPRRWADRWLEYTYGWKPLLSSIYGAAEELINITPAYSVVHGSARVKGESSPADKRVIPSSTDLTGTGIYAHSDMTSTVRYRNESYTKVSVNLRPPSQAQMLSRWSSLNPVSIAWELVPYSFVVDWFYDIGSFLRDTETAYLNNSRFDGGFNTTIWAFETSERIRYDIFNKGLVPYWSNIGRLNADWRWKNLIFNRTILSSYPFPRIPQVKTDLSANRMLSAAALLAQFLPRNGALASIVPRIEAKLGKATYQKAINNPYDFADIREGRRH